MLYSSAQGRDSGVRLLQTDIGPSLPPPSHSLPHFSKTEIIVFTWLFQELYELTNEEFSQFLIHGKYLIHINHCFYKSKLSLVPSLIWPPKILRETLGLALQ